MVGLFFTLLVIACCGYACSAGGRDGRWVSAMLLAAGLLTIPASHLDRSWSRTQIPVLAVDLLLLAGLWFIASRSRSYWPLWFVGLHLANVTTHLVTLVLPHWKPAVYYALQSFWSIPELVIMAAGIMMDRRVRRLTPHDFLRGI